MRDEFESGCSGWFNETFLCMKERGSMKRRGLMFTVLFLSAICISLSQLKVVPILGALSMTMGISIAETSWLMSVFTIAGIVLAIPGGALVGKLGPKKLVVCLMVCLFVGNVIGGVSTSYGPLLVSRMIEGVAFAMVATAGIVLINMWYPGKNSGLFIGIFMTFAAVASVIAMNTVLPITEAAGLKSVWWIVAGLSAVLAILVALVVQEAAPEGGPAGGPAPVKLSAVLSNRNVALLAFCQFCVGFVLYFFMTNYPILFGSVYGLDPATANFYTSLNGLWGIPFCIVGGFIVDRLGAKRAPVLIAVSFACLGVTCLAMTMLGTPTYIVHTFMAAVFPGLIIPAITFLIPRVVNNPGEIGYGMAIVSMLYSLGIFVGNPIVMYAIEGTGSWAIGSYILLAVCALGCVAAVAFIASAKARLAAQQPLPAPAPDSQASGAPAEAGVSAN